MVSILTLSFWWFKSVNCIDFGCFNIYEQLNCSDFMLHSIESENSFITLEPDNEYISSHNWILVIFNIELIVFFRDQAETSQPHSGSRGSQSSRHSQETLSQSLSDDTRIDTLSGASSCPSGVNVKDLLYEAYRWIGDPDGVYGCGAGRQADAMSRYDWIMVCLL